MDKINSINTLFGQVNLTYTDGKISKASAASDGDFSDDFEKKVTDKFSRENGMYGEIVRNRNTLGFITDLKKFMEDRSKKIVALIKEAKVKIRVSATEYMSRGYSANESFKLAFADHKREIDNKFKVIDYEWGLPNNFTKK